MSDHIHIGAKGEQLACEYLRSLNYKVIECNFRLPFGEIDIIARDPDGVLVITEVKTLNSVGNMNPEDNLTATKLHKLARIALFYANKNPHLILPNVGFRLDLITIVLNPDCASKELCKIGENTFAVSHYKNISQ